MQGSVEERIMEMLRQRQTGVNSQASTAHAAAAERHKQVCAVILPGEASASCFGTGACGV